ncbi:10395_t:CDS:2 [Acaulospora colombiana]|uniref:10395_t:CDS:1 n=1 Tax=Acaulospora colombiana TaxID=27376 RepID=A0ACA9KVL6_9GLOM|nr:10395_t:CDS:2 [Acaulospora colombiana]
MAIENGSTSTPSSTSNPTSTSNGSTMLPVSRVRRILKEHDATCGADVSFLITATAELFIEYLVKKGLEQAKNEGRKNLGYQDLDVIPQTCTLENALKLYDDAMRTRSELQDAMLTDNESGGEEDSDREDYSENNCEESIEDQIQSDNGGSSIVGNAPNGRLNGHKYNAENEISSDSELSEAPETSTSENSSDTVANEN